MPAFFKRRPLFCLLLLALSPLLAQAASEAPLQSPLKQAKPAGLGAFDPELADRLWQQLSIGYFGEREIVEDEQQDVVRLTAPFRTENDAFVPVSVDINTGPGAPRINKVYLIVDVNPIPTAGIFSLNGDRPLENIATRVRVNGYTYVRAIAEASDGSLFMHKQVVKSRGVACSAPPITSPEEAEQTMGRMRFKFVKNGAAEQDNAVQLMINHPNTTGMQKDQVSLLYIPEHYVKEIDVTFNDERVLKAETTFTISENPSFRFSFDPAEQGELKARIVDTRNHSYVLTQQIETGSN